MVQENNPRNSIVTNFHTLINKGIKAPEVQEYYLTNLNRLNLRLGNEQYANDKLKIASAIDITMQSIVEKAIQDIHNWYIETYYLRYNLIFDKDQLNLLDKEYFLNINLRWLSDNSIMVYIGNMVAPMLSKYKIIQVNEGELKKDETAEVADQYKAIITSGYVYNYVFERIQIDNTAILLNRMNTMLHYT